MKSCKVYYFFFLSLLICYLTAEHGEGRPMNCIINIILFLPLRAGMQATAYKADAFSPDDLKIIKSNFVVKLSHQLLVSNYSVKNGGSSSK